MKLGFKLQPQSPSEGCVTAAFAIDGMHCSSCAMSIDCEIEELAGVDARERVLNEVLEVFQTAPRRRV